VIQVPSRLLRSTSLPPIAAWRLSDDKVRPEGARKPPGKGLGGTHRVLKTYRSGLGHGRTVAFGDPRRDLRAVVQVELVHDVRDVVVDRPC
jgi:hypothetical protein